MLLIPFVWHLKSLCLKVKSSIYSAEAATEFRILMLRAPFHRVGDQLACFLLNTTSISGPWQMNHTTQGSNKNGSGENANIKNKRKIIWNYWALFFFHKVLTFRYSHHWVGNRGKHNEQNAGFWDELLGCLLLSLKLRVQFFSYGMIHLGPWSFYIRVNK